MGPLEFKGTLDSMKAEAWHMKINDIFKVIGYMEEHKASFATFYVEKGSGALVEIYYGDFAIRGRWTDYLGCFCRGTLWELFLGEVRDEKEMEFIEFIQGNKTVLQYKAIFIELDRFNLYIASDDERKVKKF